MDGFQFSHVTVSIQKKHILDDISFELKPGTITALIGHNGAGKSTIMKTILGLQEKDEGAISLNGVGQEEDFIQFKQQLAYIPEEPFLLSELTAMQHFQLYGESYQIDTENLKEKIAMYASELEITDKLDEYPESLSKGMRQKVQTICALLPDVSLLLVDEPFMGLDVYGSDFLEKILKLKKQENTAILLTSHQLDRIKGFADHYIMLQQGKVVNIGYMEDFDVLKRRFD
ncbi:ABC-2 type transport system ATP-binding protein [Natronobacillus azotifigens]|uniref:ABC transporter ATP-binding protein n=1 Tax=Natronobacillus azotifigens TaxID=472978 RepID=A0A9J6RAJ4_9BACI|nr:ABC transporter ATP-binding protein [Natronobacillus azotifigens]MCZ0702698.1 ABC transporter ATP-binding protein [Natronobacillus azotifigens]